MVLTCACLCNSLCLGARRKLLIKGNALNNRATKFVWGQDTSVADSEKLKKKKKFLLQKISPPQNGGQSLPVSKVRILQVQGTLCEKAF